MDESCENEATLVMGDRSPTDEAASVLNKAQDPDTGKYDEAGWTIPGLDEQYQVQRANSNDPPDAPKPPDSLCPEVMVGRVILGQYTLEKMLGEGGMGTVYLARQTSMDRPAAIKFLLPELGTNKEMVQRFYREAKSASGLKHPCIVQNYNFGCTDDNLMYLAMEFVEGLTLHQYLRIHKTMPWPEICELGAKMADALAVAHAANVVHRDLKPENIILQPINDRELPKILDFGIAKVVSNDGKEPTLTRLGTVFGTPSFMSPEQAQGIPINYSTDIYSLGVMFYVMLTGNLPISANSPAAQLMAVNLQPPAPLSDAVKKSTPKALQDLIFKMLEKSPANRPQSMLEVRDALEQIRATSLVGGGKAGGVKSKSSFLAKTLTAVLIAAAAAGGWFGHDYYNQFLSGDDLTLPALVPLEKDAASDAGAAVSMDKKLDASSDREPSWINAEPIKWLSNTEAHVHDRLWTANKSDGIDVMRSELGDRIMASLISEGIDEKDPFNILVVKPVTTARNAVIDELQKEDLPADRREELLAKKRQYQQAVTSMMESRFPDLIKNIDIYWEKWQKQSASGALEEIYRIDTYAWVNSNDFNVGYYTEAKSYKKVGVAINHFYPELVWLHGPVNGAIIMDVKAKSWAEKAGLKPGDVILSIDGKTAEGLAGAVDYFDKWEKRLPANRVQLNISRQGENIEIFLFDKNTPSASKNKKKRK